MSTPATIALLFVKRISLIGLIALPLACLSGCDAEDTGSDLVEITTSSTNVILAGPTSTCVDRTTYAAAGGASPLARSVGEPAVFLPKVSVKWKSTTSDLYVYKMTVTVKSSQLAGGVFTRELDSSELEAMFGEAGATLPRVIAPVTVDTNIFSSTNTAKTNLAASCGLAVGPATLVNPNSTTSFTAQVTLQLSGIATDDNGNSSTVRKTVRTTATYD